jgi:hypothetical protein
MQAATPSTPPQATRPTKIIRDLSDYQRATSTSMMALEYLIRAISKKRPQQVSWDKGLGVQEPEYYAQWWHTPQQELAAVQKMYEALRIALDGGQPDPGLAYQANFEQALGAREARSFCPELHHCLARYLGAKARGDEPGFYFRTNGRERILENLRKLLKLAVFGKYYIPQESMLADLYQKCA